MSTIGTLQNLLDWAKQVAPDGSPAVIAELLSQYNGLVRTAKFKESNMPAAHRITQRTGLPTSYWRLINQGVPSSKATTAQVDEGIGMLSARNEVDRRLAQLNGNTSQYRMNQAKAHIESMNQEAAGTMLYGVASNPEEFVGLAARYASLSGAISSNVLSAGGSTNLSSIYLVGWGENSIYGIFPKGQAAGLRHEDLGEVDIFEAGSTTNKYRGYADSFEWDMGLAVEDWRYGVRVANIDTVALAALTGTQALTASTNILKLMVRAIDRLPSRAGVEPIFYVNRTIASHLRIIAMEKSGSAVTVQPALNQFGKTIHELFVNEVRVELEDQITNAETAVA